MDGQDHFQYQGLSTPRTIRTLILQPGQRDDIIACNIQYESLNDNADYEAISYAWGDALDTKDITIDGKVASITVNLHAALE